MMRLFSSNEFVSMIEANVFLNSLMTMSREIVSVTKWSNRSYHVTLLLVPSFMWSHEWPPIGGLHKFYVFLCVFWSFSLKKPHRGIELAKRHPHVKHRRLWSIFGWKSSIGDAGADAGKGSLTNIAKLNGMLSTGASYGQWFTRCPLTSFVNHS